MTPPYIDRLKALTCWIAQQRPQNSLSFPALESVGGDAGFRKYYRFLTDDGPLLAVDAPPATENSRAFVDVAVLLRSAGVKVPEIYATDLNRGFLLLEDLGDTLMLDLLDHKTADSWYREALSVIHQIQKVPSGRLEPYSRDFLLGELQIFSDWFLDSLTGIDSSPAVINTLFDRIVEEVRQQPYTAVHRDFHSRNLMVAEGQLAVIDFQGALCGPVLYDAASLLRDCYVHWPREQVMSWLELFVAHCPLLVDVPFGQSLRWFDWTGLQRHLKCLGIFSRLALRDSKPHYLPFMPRVLDDVLDVCGRYDELGDCSEWLSAEVEPVMGECITRWQQSREWHDE